MKRILLLLLFASSISLILAQDLVVLENDSVVELPGSGNQFIGRYFMVGVGAGGCYSGLMGVMATLRTGGDVGVGFHAGIGYIPASQLVYNAGIKFYPKRGFFINAQFGVIHVGEEFDDITWDYYKQRYYGPTFMLGYERAWGKEVKVGFTGGGGLSWEIGHQVIPMLEIGFVLQIPIGDS